MAVALAELSEGIQRKNTCKKHEQSFPSLCGFIFHFSSGKMISGGAGAVFHTWKVKRCESSQFLVGVNGHMVLTIIM